MIKHAGTAVIAAAFGFLGGTVTNYRSRAVDAVGADSPVTIRATRFELVDRNGATLASWGTTQLHECGLVFRSRDKEVATFGLGSDGAPFLRFAAQDGSHRASLSVQEDRPRLVMGDKEMEGRVMLGRVPYHGGPAEGADWALSFNSPKMLVPLATIGMFGSSPPASVSGYVRVANERGKTWSAPERR